MKKFFLIVLLIFLLACCTREKNKDQLSEKINSDYKNISELTMNKPQREKKSDYNKTNHDGEKQGLWIEEEGNSRIERYYKNGVLDGTYKRFDANELSILGEYTNGKESGIWYYYEKGILMMTFENYATNYDTITSEGIRGRYKPDYKCYYKGYHPNGTIAEEGWVLWDEGTCPESDLSKEYGTWKYYDEKGCLIKTKHF